MSSTTYSLPFTEQDEENFDQSLSTSLETDVIPCLGDDRVPDDLISQRAKVLQQGSQLLPHEQDDGHLPTPSNPPQPNTTSAGWSSNTNSETMVDSTASIGGLEGTVILLVSRSTLSHLL